MSDPHAEMSSTPAPPSHLPPPLPWQVSPIQPLPKAAPKPKGGMSLGIGAAIFAIMFAAGVWNGIQRATRSRARTPSAASASAIKPTTMPLATSIDQLAVALGKASPSTRPSTTVRSGKPMTPQQLFAYASPGVVKIVVSDKMDRQISQGSGFFVNRAGLIATNFHVISGGWKAAVILPDGTSADVTGVRGVSEQSDLALLQTKLKPSVVLPIRSDTPEAVGAAAYAIGNPLGMTNTLSAGLVSGYRRVEGVNCIQTSAAISPGSSGGPLLNDRGEVLGITTMSFLEGQQLNFAVTAAEIRSLIARNDISRPLASVPAASKAAETESPARARELLLTGKPREALAMVLRLEKQYAKDVGYWECRAVVYLALNESEHVIDACRSGIAVDPAMPSLHAFMGLQLVQLERWPEAYAALKKASELGTKDANVYANAGLCCRQMNDLPKAETFYKYAIKLGSNSIPTYGLLASTQASLGRPRDAITTLEEALKLDETDPHIHCDLGDLYNRIGQRDKSVAHYSSALRYDPRGKFGRQARAALNDLKGK